MANIRTSDPKTSLMLWVIFRHKGLNPGYTVNTDGTADFSFDADSIDAFLADLYPKYDDMPNLLNEALGEFIPETREPAFNFCDDRR